MARHQAAAHSIGKNSVVLDINLSEHWQLHAQMDVATKDQNVSNVLEVMLLAGLGSLANHVHPWTKLLGSCSRHANEATNPLRGRTEAASLR